MAVTLLFHPVVAETGKMGMLEGNELVLKVFFKTHDSFCVAVLGLRV